jgi:uncharacterized membrane protein
MGTQGISRFPFAAAIASIAGLSLAYGDFAPNGTKLTDWFPDGGVWVYGPPVILLAASAGLCFSPTLTLSAWTIGVYFCAWAVGSAISAASEPFHVVSWYDVFEALAGLVATWMVCGLFRGGARGSMSDLLASARSVRAAQILFGLACVEFGLGHFAYPDYTASMVPLWLPARLGFAYLTGLAHIAAGVALIVDRLPRLAITLEALMMSLFGLMVWLPSLFMHPAPQWATPPHKQWSEIVVNFLLATSAWIVAASLRNWRWGFSSRVSAQGSDSSLEQIRS